MTSKNRISKAITVTLSPEAMEALDILKKEENSKNVSFLIDKAVKKHVTSLGYILENAMFNQVTAEIISNGSALTKFDHQGQTFLKAPSVKGQYTIRLTNKSNQRKLVVISVDGRSVMTGELADEQDSGYVLNAHQVMDLTGWRRTADEVAAFEFVELQDSYDKQVGGTGSNVGVIGIAVFNEKVIPVMRNSWIKKQEPYSWDSELYRTFSTGGASYDTKSIKSSYDPSQECDYAHDCSDVVIDMSNTIISGASAAGAAYSAETEFTSLTSERIGTGYGEKKVMATVTTTFDREDHPVQKIVLRYATESTLRKWGVIKDNLIPEVNPFPKEKPAVPAPPGWRG